MSNTTREPVLWALDFGGEPLHPDLVFASAEEAENNKRHTISYCQIVPLYRDPPPATLTDAEREALRAIRRTVMYQPHADAIDALLARRG